MNAVSNPFMRGIVARWPRPERNRTYRGLALSVNRGSFDVNAGVIGKPLIWLFKSCHPINDAR
jgi:hypothetical protein